MNCGRCGKWAGAHAILPGQPRDHLCQCLPTLTLNPYRNAEQYGADPEPLYLQIGALMVDTATPRDEWPEDAPSALGHLAGIAFGHAPSEEIGHCVGLVVGALNAASQTAPEPLKWTKMADQPPPPDVWLWVTWGVHKKVDKAHTFTKYKHHKHPLGYFIQGHPGSHNDVTHWMLLPEAPKE